MHYLRLGDTIGAYGAYSVSGVGKGRTVRDLIRAGVENAAR